MRFRFESKWDGANARSSRREPQTFSITFPSLIFISNINVNIHKSYLPASFGAWPRNHPQLVKLLVPPSSSLLVPWWILSYCSKENCNWILRLFANFIHRAVAMSLTMHLAET